MAEDDNTVRVVNNQLIVRSEFNLVPIELPDRRPITPSLRCRFYNTTSRSVDLIWIRQDGFTQKYNSLKLHQFETVGTYEGHCWKFCDSFDGEEFISFPNGKNKFVASLAHRFVFICADSKNLSLQRCCFRSICSDRLLTEITSQFILDLGLPKILERELIEYLIRCVKYQSKYSEEIFKISAAKCVELTFLLKKDVSQLQCS